ncbi:MAG: extracellular solute-binding protein [Clostridiales bacterium]|nr:extracellular solute-binding protein [Clostridiales bacterium]
MKKLLILTLVVLMIAAVAFTGCQKEEAEKTEAPKVTEAPTEKAEDPTPEPEVKIDSITVTSGLWSQPLEQQFIREEVLPEFEAATGVTVNLEVVSGNDILDMLEAQKASGEWATDVVMTHSGDMPKYIGFEYVTPLNDLLADMDITILEAFNGSTSEGGNTYYIPISADVYLTIANNKALPYLPAGADMETLTWEQYKEWAIAMAVGEGTPRVAFPAEPVTAVVYQMGGIGLSYGAGFPEINTDGLKSAWGLVGEMMAADAILEASFNYGNPIDMMKSEEAWLSFYHMVPVGEVYSSAPAKFTIGPAPAGPVGNGTIAGAWGIGITAGTEKKSAADDFVKFITSEKILYKISAGTGGFIPPVEEVIEVLGNEPTDEVIKKGLGTLNAGIPHGVPGSNYQDWGAVKTVYDEVFQKLWDDDGVVDVAFLDTQQAKLEALLLP